MDLTSLVRNIPDFPKRGVIFRDITTLLKNKDALRELIGRMADSLTGIKADVIVSPEARGFIIGSALAYELGTGFVVARKPGKLPGKTRSCAYGLEYGTDVLEMHEDAIEKGQRVVIADDLLATGGTSLASIRLAEQAGGSVVAVRFAIELADLHGREVLNGYDVASAIVF